MNTLLRRCINCNTEVSNLTGKLKDHSQGGITTRVPICNKCVEKEQSSLILIRNQELDSKTFINANLIIFFVFIFSTITVAIILKNSEEYLLVVSLIFSWLQSFALIKYLNKRYIVNLKLIFKIYFPFLIGISYYFCVLFSEVITYFDYYFKDKDNFLESLLTIFYSMIGIFLIPYHLITLVLSIIICVLVIRNWSKQIPSIKYYPIK